MKTAFWACVIAYYAIVITKFYILPAFRRRERTVEKAALAKYWNCH